MFKNSFSCRCGSFYVGVGRGCLVYIYYLARGKYQPIISVYLYPNSSSNIYIEANDFSLLEIEWWVTVVHFLLNPTMCVYDCNCLQYLQPAVFLHFLLFCPFLFAFFQSVCSLAGEDALNGTKAAPSLLFVPEGIL